MNNKNTADIISFLKWPMTMEQALQWCKRSEKGLENQNEFLFIAKNKESAPIGCICLLINHVGIAEIGYWVTLECQALGFATEMLKAIMDFAFKRLELTTLMATAAIGNPISLRVLEKQGFQIVGEKDLHTAKGTLLKCHLLQKNHE